MAKNMCSWSARMSLRLESTERPYLLHNNWSLSKYRLVALVLYIGMPYKEGIHFNKLSMQKLFVLICSWGSLFITFNYSYSFNFNGWLRKCGTCFCLLRTPSPRGKQFLWFWLSLGHKCPYERCERRTNDFLTISYDLLKAAVRNSSVRRPFVSSQPGRWSCPRFLRTLYENPSSHGGRTNALRTS